jgi:glutamyl-tRNA synthetase
MSLTFVPMSVRVRFAPSPTGGLHIGGVRTVLYNYLYARKHGGQFVLRIEDTDQSRYVEGAEEYIHQCLAWCGLQPDESALQGGPYGPYRQSERKPMYREYADKLVAGGHAYYAFDTPEELTAMRESFKTAENPTPQYGAGTRERMRNSLNLGADETKALIDAGIPYVIRIRMPQNERVSFNDMIRGEVSFDTGLVDDKVLLKADGMPTYHLAVVVDDFLMKITHAFRGEEWLPSAPVHVLLWKYLGWEAEMPQWAHLPLILGPDGSKLSKRHGSKFGFPIFAMNWTDPRTGDFTEGFAERGFLPQAVLNMLAMLGWNDGSGQELFPLDELIQRFDLSRVSHSGAVFDFEKAKWYNHQYIQQLSADELLPLVKPYFEAENYSVNDAALITAIGLVKERCSLLPDFVEQAGFFFRDPETIDTAGISAKWKPEHAAFFNALATMYDSAPMSYSEGIFNKLVTDSNVKKGEVMLPLRIMLVGGKFGPGVFDIVEAITAPQAAVRIRKGLEMLRAL